MPFFLFLAAEIQLVSETTEEELKAAEGDKPELTEGVRVAYTKPADSEKVTRVESSDPGGSSFIIIFFLLFF